MSEANLPLTSFRGGQRQAALKIAVVIPCYRAATTIESVIGSIGTEVAAIYCVDDASPDDTARVLDQLAARDARVRVVRRPVNGGVGAATVDGYRAAIADGMGILVKIDSDGQMDPALIPDFIAPILSGQADYVKGNRFFNADTVGAMPAKRVIGNAGLSFLTKLSTGYWDLFDPTNGYTAIHADVAAALPQKRLHPRFFFESDLLFRLSTVQARVIELPLMAQYNAPNSHLNELRCLVTFPGLHLRNLAKRIGYNYFLRNFSLASVNLVLGILLAGFGFLFGLIEWVRSVDTGVPATTGTVMLSALPFLLGIQFLLSFLSHDMAMAPREPVHPRIARLRILAPRSDRGSDA
jgi:glycosyltransferase involved in cell wall biosynthesis